MNPIFTTILLVVVHLSSRGLACADTSSPTPIANTMAAADDDLHYGAGNCHHEAVTNEGDVRSSHTTTA